MPKYSIILVVIISLAFNAQAMHKVQERTSSTSFFGGLMAFFYSTEAKQAQNSEKASNIGQEQMHYKSKEAEIVDAYNSQPPAKIKADPFANIYYTYPGGSITMLTKYDSDGVAIKQQDEEKTCCNLKLSWNHCDYFPCGNSK